MLGRELRRRGDLDLGDVAERALRERREPAQRFDLDVEHVHPHGPLLGSGEHVEQSSAQRELPALLHLVDALVARADELLRALVEVEQLAHAQRERVGTQRRVGHLLRQRHRADDHHRLLALRALLLGGVVRGQQRVERRHAQADEVRWRREMGLVGDAARGVVADRPRREPRTQVGREVARRAVVAHHDQGGTCARGRVDVGERGDQVCAQRARDERVATVAREPLGRLVLVDQPEQGAQDGRGGRLASVGVLPPGIPGGG